MTGRSMVPGIGWPGVWTGRAATLQGVLAQLGESQWWTPERLAAAQFRQLDALVAFARETVPFYAERLAAAGIRPGVPLDAVAWARIPVLTRREVGRLGDALRPAEVPAAHGAVTEVATGGSTGVPVRVAKTDMAQVMWEAVQLRQLVWHRRDFRGTVAKLGSSLGGLTEAAKAAERSPDGVVMAHWGPPVDWFWETGRVVGLNRQGLDEQVAFLRRHRPVSVWMMPSRLGLLVNHIRAHKLAVPAVESFWTWSEGMTDALRERCREVFGARIVDSYSAAETGFLALQCPDCESFHAQAETVKLEVLDAAGRECGPGEIGRVVATPLHNFAHPLLRYEIGDEAEVGPACGCGRGLGVLRRVVGRTMDMLVLPSGQRRRPRLQHYALSRITAILEFRFVQRTVRQLELMLVVARDLTEAEMETARGVAQEVGEGLEISISLHDSLPRTRSGKLRSYVCEVPEEAVR